MEEISWTRVILCGLVAGFVTDVFVLGPVLGATHLFLGNPGTVALTAVMAAMVIILAVITTSLYAGVRLRYGSAIKTALLVGVLMGGGMAVFECGAWLVSSLPIPFKVCATCALVTLVALIFAT